MYYFNNEFAYEHYQKKIQYVKNSIIKPTIIQPNRKCLNISVEQASKYIDPMHIPSTIKVAHPNNKAAQPEALGW